MKKKTYGTEKHLPSKTFFFNTKTKTVSKRTEYDLNGQYQRTGVNTPL